MGVLPDQWRYASLEFELNYRETDCFEGYSIPL